MQNPKAKNTHVRHGLVIKYNEVPSSGLDYVFRHTTGELNTVLFDIMGDYPVYETLVKIEPADNMVMLKGDLSGELRLTCSRCAEEFSKEFKKNFVTAYYKSETSLKNFGWDADDLVSSFDLEFLEGETINIGEAIHEQIALEIPFTPLCTESCKGLCVKCGTNLNDLKCECKNVTAVVDKKVSVFEKLKVLSRE